MDAKACPRGAKKVRGRCVQTTPKFGSGDIVYLNDVVDEFGKIKVKIKRSQFVGQPEVWGYKGKPQNFYSFKIIDPDYDDVELSYSYIPESFLSKKR